jgi:hypothetical protein
VMAMFFRKSFAFKVSLLQNKRSFQNPELYTIPIGSIKSLLLISPTCSIPEITFFCQVPRNPVSVVGFQGNFWYYSHLWNKRKTSSARLQGSSHRRSLRFSA